LLSAIENLEFMSENGYCQYNMQRYRLLGCNDYDSYRVNTILRISEQHNINDNDSDNEITEYYLFLILFKAYVNLNKSLK
jgi:hypothetical protein